MRGVRRGEAGADARQGARIGVAAAEATTVRFKGSPERLTGLAPAPGAGPLDLQVRLDLPEPFQSALPAYAQPLTGGPGAPALLRLALPSSTPPGTYTGT